MKRKVLALVMAAVFTLSMGLTGCAPKQQPAAQGDTAKAAEPKVFRYTNTSDPTFMDPQRASADTEIQDINYVMEGLMRTVGGELKPGMAESYDVSPDGLVYTFHLRDAKWSDGKPVTAGDFVYGWKRALDPKLASYYAYLLHYVKGGKAYNSGKGSIDQIGVVAKDDKTFEVTLEAPVPFFPSLTAFITMFPARQDIVEKYGEKYFAEASNAVFNGPYALSKWEHESSMEFTKNDSYWEKDKININKIEIYMVSDTNTEVNMYLAGDIDMVNSLRGPQLEQIPAEEIKDYNRGSVWYVSFSHNEKAGILKNKNIRKALTYALDRNTIIQKIVKQKDSKPAFGICQPEIVPGKSKTFREEAGDYFKDADIEAAKAALAQGLKELGLKELPTLKFMVNDTDDGRELGQGLQEMWKKSLGINIELEPVPSNVRIERLHAEDYQISQAGWGPDYPDAISDLDIFESTSGNNDYGYNSPEYDKLIEAAKKEADAGKRIDILMAAEKMIIDDMVVGPMYYQYRNYALKPYVKGLVRFPYGQGANCIYGDIVK